MSLLTGPARDVDRLPPEIVVGRLPAVKVSPSKFCTTCKGTVDFFFALLLLLASSPAVLLSMFFIKLTSRGPAFYTQTRVGKNGKPFVIYKLRTMAHQCESQSGVRWSTPNDPRVTMLGRVLRKTHLDELPQLWNVLKGDMSLIGPRPERPEFVPRLEQALAHYRGRLLMKPGLSGFAQVQLPPDTDLTSVRLKLAFDLYYVQHATLWLDCRILLATICKCTAVPFSALRCVFGFPKKQDVEQEYKALTPNS